MPPTPPSPSSLSTMRRRTSRAHPLPATIGVCSTFSRFVFVCPPDLELAWCPFIEGPSSAPACGCSPTFVPIVSSFPMLFCAGSAFFHSSILAGSSPEHILATSPLWSATCAVFCISPRLGESSASNSLCPAFSFPRSFDCSTICLARESKSDILQYFSFFVACTPC